MLGWFYPSYVVLLGWFYPSYVLLSWPQPFPGSLSGGAQGPGPLSISTFAFLLPSNPTGSPVGGTGLLPRGCGSRGEAGSR